MKCPSLDASGVASTASSFARRLRGRGEGVPLPLPRPPRFAPPPRVLPGVVF